MNRHRVAITGLGCITALGESSDELFRALCEGKSGVSRITSFDTSSYPVRIGGEIRTFDATRYVDKRASRRMDRFTQFAVGAAKQAVEESGLEFSKEDLFRVGVIVGTGIGGIKEIEEQHIRLLNGGPTRVSPFCVPRLMANAASGNIAIQYGLEGTNISVTSACASGSHAIGEAYCNIAFGRSDIIITGGTEAALTPVGLASFCAARSLSKRNDEPELASRPFDKDRDGFVLSEGAGILILEEYEHARSRGANIYAEVKGYGATDDGHHITAPLPDGSGAAKAMKAALAEAELGLESIDYVNAHGTGTKLNDIAECKAISSVFGEHVSNLTVSSTKGCLGHSLGATGAIEILVCAKVIQESVIPPTINLDNLDEECDPRIDFVAHRAKEKNVDYTLSNSLGFGGHNASLVLGKV